MEICKRSKVLKPLNKFRKLSIPKGFILVIDTREQTPLFSKPQIGIKIVYKALKHGDYSIVGLENKVTIERKQTSDFLLYVGKERSRTIKKMEAMRDMFFKALVIETNNPYNIPAYSQLTSETIRGFLRSARVRYGIHIYYNKNRNEIERFVLDHLIQSYKVLREI